MIVGLLLAAGRSARFGADKLVAPLRGVAVVRRSAEPLAAAVDLLHVVVRPCAPEVGAALHGIATRLVENPDAAEGMASSIRHGVASLPPGCECVIVAHGDQPFVRPEVIAALVARWRESGAGAVAPMYRDGRGNPVLFGRALFGELLALTGDAGARSLLQRLGDRLALVDVEGDAPADVDTPEALRALADGRD